MNKIALLGNMNNNGFSLLRHMIDYGFDVDLLLFSEDLKRRSSAHFLPIEDAWCLEKYNKSIRIVDVSFDVGAMLSRVNLTYKFISIFIYLVKFVMNNESSVVWRPLISDKKLLKVLSEYKYFIGSSVHPAILSSYGKKCIIYFPYANGVEYYEEKEFNKYVENDNYIVKKIAKKVKEEQRRGLQSVDCIITSELGETFRSLREIGITPVISNIPIVYHSESPCEEMFSDFLIETIDEIKGAMGGVFFSHSRHLWSVPDTFNNSENEWDRFISKHNDWLIEAFSLYVKNKDEGAKLILVEYGSDVDASKDLIVSLGIENNVTWLPILGRKEILVIMDYIDVGIGEFYAEPTGLGGAQLEFISKGKPLITGVLPKSCADDVLYPKILEAGSKNDIYECMCRWNLNRSEFDKNANDNKEWYENSVVKNWMSIIDHSVNI